MKKLLTLLLSLVLVFSLVACGSKTETPAADKGTEAKVLNGSAKGYGDKNIEVAVTKEGDKITKVEVLSNSETAEVGGEALKKLVAAVEEKGSADVELVAGATVTSEAFIKAVKEAK